MSEIKEQPIQFSPEEMDMVQSPSDYIEENIIHLDTKKLDKARLDDILFAKGINSVSELCGAISALVSVGISPPMAMMYLSEREGTILAMEHTLNLSKINANATVEASKFESINLQKNML